MNYFKDENLNLLFSTLKEKYIKTSRLSGSIKIIPNVSEAYKIGRFLGLNLKPDEENIIKIKDIEKAINKSKFEGLNLIEILNYLYKNLKTKEEIITEEILRKNLLLKELLKTYENTPIYLWFVENITKKDIYQKVMYILTHEKKLIYNILSSLINLPAQKGKMVNISIFSSIITKDPHYFDLDTSHNHDLVWFICKFKEIEFNNNRAFKIDVLNSVGIYMDNISNFVITFNLYGPTYLNELSNKKEVAILSLNNLNNLEEVYSLNKKIIILENPSLLNVIISKNYQSGFIITSGNLNIACYNILDKLKNHEFYYNGDFDPEGLLIADKLLERYQNLSLIGYEKELFLKSISSKELSVSRIKKLTKVNHEKLKEIKEEMIISKKAGYQEKIIDDLLKIIERK